MEKRQSPDFRSPEVGISAIGRGKNLSAKKKRTNYGSNAHYSADSRVQTWVMLVGDRGSHHDNSTPAQYQNMHSCCYLSSFIFKLPVTCLI